MNKPSPAYLPALLVLFVGSGCAALIYEIVWLQLLQLVIGSSAVSLGVLLGTFMGGMCLGSLMLPRYVRPDQNPLRVYAFIELALAVVGIAVLFAMPYVGGLYAFSVTHGFPGVLLRGVLCAVCLLPPTMLMGATLPAIARWVGVTGNGVSWLGLFYGANIAGAVCGCLLAGFYLLRVHDMATATYVAASINVAVGVLGLAIARRASFSVSASPESRDAETPDVSGRRTVRESNNQIGVSGPWAVYLTIAISGCCALGAEVVWTRVLSLMLGGTVYTFSLILAVFLMGLGIGSSAGSFLSRSLARPRIALGWCQLLLAVACGWTAWMLGRSVPYWPINPWLSTSPWFNFQIDLVRCIWALLPAACLWGASFPLALAAVASKEQDPGRLVGSVYAANTLGAIAGAVGFSLVVVPMLGVQGSQRLLIGLSTVAALLAFAPSPARAATPAPATTPPIPLAAVIAREGAIAAVAALVALLFWTAPGIPPGLVAYGRSLPTRDETGIRYLYVGEGMNSAVAVSELSNGVRNFHVSGKVEASTEPQDMRLQRMLGNIPALLHPKPTSVLVVGFGAGVTAGSFVPYRDVQRLVICEIERLIPRHIGPYFEQQNYAVLRDPRATVFFDDARHHVLTMRDNFDIITSDPIHPWVKGAATLYTKEYFELVKRHLNPGGLVTQWVPLYESNPEVVKSEIATFFEVFPGGTVWGNVNNGEGYDVVLLGQKDPAPLDLDAAQRRLSGSDRAAVAASLQEVGFPSLREVVATYAGQASDLAPWLRGAQINTDRNLRLQYLAGLGLNQYRSGAIYSEMLAYRRFPADRFTGAPDLTQTLRAALGIE